MLYIIQQSTRERVIGYNTYNIWHKYKYNSENIKSLVWIVFTIYEDLESQHQVKSQLSPREGFQQDSQK